MMTLKKYCEENNLEPSRVFNAVFGECSDILPKAMGYTGYIVEIKDDCLDFNNDKFGVFHKEIPYSSFSSAEFGIGSGNLWLQCVVDGKPFIFCNTRGGWKSEAGKLIIEKIGAHTEIKGMDDYNKIMGKLFWFHFIMSAW